MRDTAFRRGACTAAVAAALAAGAAPASGAVTLGQTPATAPPISTCSNVPADWIQPTEISGRSYVVPAIGRITSWSTYTSPTANQQWSMRVYRRVTGSTYTVIFREAPHTLEESTLNTFPIDVPVQPGDLIGMNPTAAGNANSACLTESPGNHVLWRSGNLALGASAQFVTQAVDRRMNLSAVFEPSNAFTLGKIVKNKKKGTATVTATFPNAGRLVASGKGVKLIGGVNRAVPAGAVALEIKAKGKKKRKLRTTGKVKLGVFLSYTPANGAPGVQRLNLKLKRRKPAKR